MSLWMVVSSAWATSPFPEDASYTALPCPTDGEIVSFDPPADEADAPDERDLVGNDVDPAGFFAADPDNLFLRMRLDADPLPDGEPGAHAWGFWFDLDGDVSTFEVLARVNGEISAIELYTNTTTTAPHDPADPPDLPPAVSLPFGSAVRSVRAGSTFHGDDDWFLDIAVPRSDLIDLGFSVDGTYSVGLATSGTALTLDGDRACADGEAILQGGGGCTHAPRGAGCLALLGLFSLRRRASCPR
jgi:hypothetical protein